MGAASKIAAKDLRLRIRDRSVFILAVLVPLALALIFDAVFGSALEQGELSLEYGVVDEDHSDLSLIFLDTLRAIEGEGVLTLTVFDGRSEADAAVESGEMDAYFLVSEGLGAAVAQGGSGRIEVVGEVDAPTSTQIATSIAEQFGAGVATAQLSVSTSAAMLGAEPTEEQIAAWTEAAVAAERPFMFSDVSAATRQLDAPTYFAAGMAVFFLFFTVQFGVSGLLEEERQGTLSRLMSAPIGRMSVVAGKAILAFVIGIVATTILIGATRLLIGASWGAPWGVVMLVVAGVLCSIGIMGLVASAAKTPEGAGNMGAIVAVILGMLGGVFFPIGSGDDLLSKLQFITPHAWFMRGLGDLADGAEWTAALPATAALLVFAAVSSVVAVGLLRRRYRG